MPPGTGPLALITSALLTALPAAWLANLVARGESRSRLLATSGISLLGLVAGLAASTVLVRVLYSSVPFRSLWPAVAGWMICGLIFAAAAASVAAWRLRRPAEGRLGPLGWVALAFAGIWAIVLPLDRGIAYQLGLVGAGFGPVVPLWGVVGGSFAFAVGGAALLAWQAYGPGSPEGASAGTLDREAAWTLMLAGLAPALVVGGIFVGCRLTYCGA